ncbi:MAG: hypothetical protein R2795_02200 [Saprospiraceae bacterium]
MAELTFDFVSDNYLNLDPYFTCSFPADGFQSGGASSERGEQHGLP